MVQNKYKFIINLKKACIHHLEMSKFRKKKHQWEIVLKSKMVHSISADRLKIPWKVVENFVSGHLSKLQGTQFLLKRTIKKWKESPITSYGYYTRKWEISLKAGISDSASSSTRD